MYFLQHFLHFFPHFRRHNLCLFAKTEDPREELRADSNRLGYTYMKEYIITHGTKDDLKIYDEMKLISECHSKAFRYPTIKAWFLERFPEIKAFGVKEDAAEEIAEEAATDAPITNLPVELGTAV